MTPGSGAFVVATGVAWLLYWWGPSRLRREALVLVSYAALLVLTPMTGIAVVAIGVVGWADCRLQAERAPRVRRGVLTAGLVVVLVLLVAGTIFIRSEGSVRTLATSGLLIASMHAVSLMVDSFREPGSLATSLWDTLLFCGFFATVSVGPLTRMSRLDRSLRQAPQRPNLVLHSEALELAVVGAFKLLVVASALAPTVGAGYLADISGDVRSMSVLGLLLWSSVVRIQSYLALSGSIDIARAAGLTLNIRLPREVRRPLTASVDVTDYWRRHHATFMAWARDYVFRAFRSGASLGGWLPLALTFLPLSLIHGLSIRWVLNALLVATLVWWEVRSGRRAPRGRAARTWAVVRVWLLLTAVSIVAFGGSVAWHSLTTVQRWRDLAGVSDIAPSVVIAAVGLALADWHSLEMERERLSRARDVVVGFAAVALLLWVGTSVVPPFAYRQ